MEQSRGVSDGGNVVPPRVSESTVEIEPELYNFSSFLEGDIVDDFFPEFKEILKAASSPSSGHVVPEVVEEVLTEKNIEQVDQPAPAPTPPQHPAPIILSSPQGSRSLKWTKELHACFLDAVGQLGGPFAATPKTVRDTMRVEGLTLHQVKSHLQKHRASKLAHRELKHVPQRGSSFCRALGGPTKPVASAEPSQANNQSEHRAKPNKEEYGSLHARIEFQRHLQRLFEAQRLHAKIAISRVAASATQTMGGYQSAPNQNMRGYPFSGNQNIGGQGFAPNQKMGAYPLTGPKIYPENSFIREATVAPMPSCYPYQLNQHNASTSAAATYAGTSIVQKPDKLQDLPEAHPHQVTQASIRGKAVLGSCEQGLNSAPGENNEIPGMSDEEFIASFLIDFDEIIGEDENSQ